MDNFSLESIHQESNFFLIAGPCAVESKSLLFEIAEKLKKLCLELSIPLIFKASYKKANRTRLDSFTSIGEDKAIGYLKAVKEEFNIPITTDIHSVEEARKLGKIVDVLQIPAFLCRQTELLIAAAQTGKPVNIKKGQFAGPAVMEFAIEKVIKSGGKAAWVTERGSTFGYQDLVVDFRNIPKIKAFNVPVILDCTHSLQQPNRSEGVTGGQPALIETIAKAGIAVGVDGLFIETHPKPAEALSDGANMLELDKIEALLKKLIAIRKAISAH